MKKIEAGLVFWIPTAEEIAALSVGDMALNCFGSEARGGNPGKQSAGSKGGRAMNTKEGFSESVGKCPDGMESVGNRYMLRAGWMARDAIGKEFRVKVGANAFYSGTIRNCEYVGTRRAGRSVVARWKVWINMLPPVIVERLPR